MISVNQIEQNIPNLTGLAVLIIAVCAFALSFFNLQAAALEAGIKPWLSWLWPVCVDALLIAGSLMILRSSLRNESPIVGWVVLLSFTGVSILFNVVHSPTEIISQAAHAVPPVALCVSIELLMMTIRSDIAQQQDRDKKCDDTKPVQQIVQGKRLRKNAERILQYFVANPDCNITDASDELNLHKSTVSRNVKRLVSMGLLQNEVRP